MKTLTARQFRCAGMMSYEVGMEPTNKKVRLHLEHGVYQLLMINVLGAGKVWHNYTTHKDAIKNFRLAVKAIDGQLALNNIRGE